VASAAPLTIRRQPFGAWLPEFYARWEQGQHLSLIGPTGQGKTTLTRKLLPRRNFVVILASKPRDRGLSAIVREDGYTHVKAWKKRPKPVRVDGQWSSRIMLWPDLKDLDGDLDQQDSEFRECMADVFVNGGWCVVADDVSWQVEMLDHARPLKALWKLGRSSECSLVANIQRPAFVPLDAYSQASHLCLWQSADERDTQTIGGLGGLPSAPIRATVRALPEHEFLNIEPRRKLLAITRVE
jgi:hypothetical protein